MANLEEDKEQKSTRSRGFVWVLGLFIISLIVILFLWGQSSSFLLEDNAASPESHLVLDIRVLQSGDTKLPMGKMFDMEVRFQASDKNYQDARLRKFEADMPEHGHGMMVEPLVMPGKAPAQYFIQYVKFHMPGTWRLRFFFEHEGENWVEQIYVSL